MNEKPWLDSDEDIQRRRTLMHQLTNERDAFGEGSRSSVNDLNRRNRELLAANVRLQDENQTLRRRLRALGERV